MYGELAQVSLARLCQKTRRNVAVFILSLLNTLSLVQIVEAVESLHSEFRGVDNLVAHNTNRVLKAFQNARVGSHVSK